MRGRRVENTENIMKKIIAFISIFIIGIAILIAWNSNNDNSITSNYNSSYTDNKINNYTSTNSNNTIEVKKHYCDASGCTKNGTYSIDGVSGKEYYCYEHYKQMEAWAEMFMGY